VRGQQYRVARDDYARADAPAQRTCSTSEGAGFHDVDQAAAHGAASTKAATTSSEAAEEHNGSRGTPTRRQSDFGPTDATPAAASRHITAERAGTRDTEPASTIRHIDWRYHGHVTEYGNRRSLNYPSGARGADAREPHATEQPQL